MRRFIQTNPFSNYTPSVSSTPTYGESAMTPAAPAPANTGSQLSSNQLMGILQMMQMMQMMQNQRNQASQQAPTQYRQRAATQGPQNQGALSYASNVAPLPFGSFGMSGEEGNEQPYFQLNGQNMTVDQYNQMQRQKVIDMARKQGREVREPTRPFEATFSLFGPMVLPTPLTEAQFAARGQYAASQRGTPEQEAFNRKVNALIKSGKGIGWGNYAKDGKVYHGATGKQITGYGYGDLSVPQFFLGNAVDPKRRTNANAAARQQNNLNTFGNARGGVSLFGRANRR